MMRVRESMIDIKSIRVSEMTSTDKWDAYVKSYPGSTFYHLSGWKGAFEKVFRFKTFYLEARVGDRIVGVLPLVFLKTHNVKYKISLVI